MKDYIYILLCTVVFTACRKEDSKPVNGNVDERVEVTMATYQAQLTSAKFGWKGYLNAGPNGVYTFLFNFNNSNRVIMSADYKTDPVESSYRLKALQQPGLLFDTYSTLHLLQDPDPAKFNGTRGSGKSADFEFRFVSATTDTIKLEGLFNKTSLILVRSVSDTDNNTVFKAGEQMKTLLSNLKTYFKRVTIAGVTYEMRLDLSVNNISFSSYENGVRNTVNGEYYTDGNKIVFFKPLVLGKTVLYDLTDVNYDAGTGAVAVTALGIKTQILLAIAPLVYDKTAADLFLKNPSNLGLYWKSDKGFTVNGITDGFNLTGNIPDYSGIYFYPTYFDPPIFRFWTNADAPTGYSLGYKSWSVADGKLLLNSTSLYGSSGGPKSDFAQGDTSFILEQPEGFYVINTGPQRYDLVNVKDATAWISFK